MVIRGETTTYLRRVIEAGNTHREEFNFVGNDAEREIGRKVELYLDEAV